MNTLALCALMLMTPIDSVRPMHIVFLMSGDANAIPEAQRAKAQTEHLKYLESLWTSKRAGAIGPIQNGGDIRGITILDTGDRETARKWMAGDPMVSSGALKASIMRWQGDASVFLHQGKFLDIVSHRLVLLRREPTTSAASGLWQRHAQHLEKLTQEKMLLMSGPFLDSDRWHSVLVFEGGLAETEYDTLLNADPAISLGALKADSYTWLTSKGSLARLP